MLKILNPILGKYMKENNISVVIDKKNVLMGDKKFEITSQIIEILNKEFKSIKFKLMSKNIFFKSKGPFKLNILFPNIQIQKLK